MKLDGESKLCNSTLARKPDSKLYNDNILNDGLKENQNGILCCDVKGCEKNADILPHEMNDKDGLWASPTFECSMGVDDLPNGNGIEIRDSAEQYAYTSSKVDILEADPNFYTDKSVMECELPELVVCKESSDHDVKDICIDEGVPSSLDKILIECDKSEHTSQRTFVTCNGDKNTDLSKEKVDIELPVPDGLKSVVENACNVDAVNQCESENLIQQNGEANKDATDRIASDVSEDKLLPHLVEQSCMENSLTDSSKVDSNEVEQQSVQVLSEKEISASPGMVSGVEGSNSSNTVNELSYNSRVESGSITFNFGSSTLAASKREETTQNVESEQPTGAPNMSGHENDGVSGTVPSQVQHGRGESSFSMAGPLSGLITYSGPIPYSGSLSHRSDSSTTSTRSFAFPVLQSEWNSSPVRMAKADRRHYRKHRGWRLGLCCRF